MFKIAERLNVKIKGEQHNALNDAVLLYGVCEPKYTNVNLTTQVKLPVCHIVCQNEKSSVEGHMTGGIWNDSDKEKDGVCHDRLSRYYRKNLNPANQTAYIDIIRVPEKLAEDKYEGYYLVTTAEGSS